MPWGAMRHYGRKIVVSEVAFDNAVSDEAKNRRNSLFCSSDSSHTSSHNSSVTLFMDHAPQKPAPRQTRKTKKQNCLQSESRHRAKKKKKDVDDDSVEPVNSANSSLFHEGSQMCTPIKAKRKRGALMEINSQSSTRQTKVTKQAKPVGRQKNNKNNMARHVDSGEFTENLPDFDAIEQDDFIIASTPNGRQQCSDDRLGHSVSIMRSSSLDVSDIGGSFDHSGVIGTGSSSLSSDHMEQHRANVTFRTRKKTTKSRRINSEDKLLPDNGNLSNNGLALDGSVLYELVDSSRLCDAENSNTNSDIDTSQLNDESSLASVSLRACSVEDLSHSFRVMHLRSRDLTQRLLRGSQISTCGSRNVQAADGDPLPSELCVSPELFDESSLSLDTHSPPLPQITEEDSCYSEDAYDESEEYESDDKSNEEDSEDDDSKDEHDEVEEENDEIEEENSEVEEEHYEEEENRDDKEMGGSVSEDDEELMQEQQNSSKLNVTLYELVNSMSFSERLSCSSLCTDVTVTASERVLTLCGQTQPISFSDCIPPKVMSRCIKIGEGVYGEVFRSMSGGETVALKIIPIEGHQHVNDCPQKKFDEILPEIVIARELSDLANCGSNQTSNFCQVNRVSCVKGAFPSTLLEQWDVYSQKKVSENDRPDMFGDDQLFIVFEFLDGGCPLENYKFVNHMEALSMLRQVVFALAVAESHLEFEHRDLHIGNVLVRPCQEETISFVLRGREYQFPTAGVKATIIDFTISRLKKDGCAVFCDVSTDEGLFEGKGDFQFDVYRDMRTYNKNDWQVFCPHSNVLWVNYLCKKLTSVIKVEDTGRSHRNVQRHLRGLVDSVLDYSCCSQMAEDPEIWSVSD